MAQLKETERRISNLESQVSQLRIDRAQLIPTNLTVVSVSAFADGTLVSLAWGNWHRSVEGYEIWATLPNGETRQITEVDRSPALFTMNLDQETVVTFRVRVRAGVNSIAFERSPVVSVSVPPALTPVDATLEGLLENAVVQHILPQPSQQVIQHVVNVNEITQMVTPGTPSPAVAPSAIGALVAQEGFDGFFTSLIGLPGFLETFDGSYDSLTGKPMLNQGTFDGAYSSLTGLPTLFSGAYADLTGKPTLFSGSYNDLTNLPQLFNGAYSALTGLPTLFSGAYADLSGLPTLFSGSYNDLANLPTLFSGNYNDLTNKPTIPTTTNGDDSEQVTKGALVQQDGFDGFFTSLIGLPEFLETFDGAYTSLTGLPTLFSGSYDDLTNKPDLADSLADAAGDAPTFTFRAGQENTFREAYFRRNSDGALVKSSIQVAQVNEAGLEDNAVSLAKLVATLRDKINGIETGAQVNEITQADLDVAFNGASINGGILTLARIGGSSPINLTLPTSGNGAMADGVVVSASIDVATQIITLTTSTNATVAINLSPVLATFLNQSQVDARARIRYTDAEKTKAAGVATGAQVNVKPDWNALESAVAGILNKPELFGGSYDDLTNKPTIPSLDELGSLLFTDAVYQFQAAS